MKVPNGWEVIKLKDIGKCVTGLTYSPNNVIDKGLLVLRSSNIKHSKLVFNDNVYVNIDLDKNSKTKYGDILLCIRNGSKNLIGKSAFIDKNSEGYAHGAFMSIFRTSAKPEYIFQLFQSYIFFKQVHRNLGATINSINSSDLYNFKFLYPPANEREKIAKILGCWDRAIATCEQLIATSKQQKQALMQQLLTAKKRFGEFTGEWQDKKLAFFIREKKKEKENSPMNIELLTVRLHYKGVTPSGKYPKPTKNGRPYYKRKAGELIIGRQNLHNGGVAIVPKNCDNLVASNAISSFEATKHANIFFILNLMSQPQFKFTIDNLTGGTGQKEISIIDLLNIKVFVPQIKEQQKIAQVLTAADSEIEILQQKLAKLQQEKQALMQQLLTGKRRVKVDESDLVTS